MSQGIVGSLVILAGAVAAGHAQDQPGRQVFRSRVDLITTDVSVRDARGRFVPDLKKHEFQVFEDGVKQEIVSLVRVQGGRVFAEAPPAEGAAREGIVVPPAGVRPEESGRIFVVFIDDQHLDGPNTPRVRDLLRRIANGLIRDGDLYAAVSTGTSSIAIDMNYDRKRLLAAIDRVVGQGLSPNEIVEAASGRPGGTVSPEIAHRAHVAFRTAYDMLRQLEKVPHRRKAFLYVSNGYDFNPFADTRGKQDAERLKRMIGEREVGANPFTGAQTTFAEADLTAQLAELTRAANRANTSIYTMDPRGLVAGPDINQRVDMVEWQAHLTTTQSTLRVIADLTGGFAMVNSNDFDRGLKRIDLETSDYYVLGYYSSNPDTAKRRRRIEITVTRKGLDVRGRTEYALPPPSR